MVCPVKSAGFLGGFSSFSSGKRFACAGNRTIFVSGASASSAGALCSGFCSGKVCAVSSGGVLGSDRLLQPPNSFMISSREYSSCTAAASSICSCSFVRSCDCFFMCCSCYTLLCRTASYSMIAAAADALRDEILPFMGILTLKSQLSETRRLMPCPSLPMTMAAAPLRSAL